MIRPLITAHSGCQGTLRDSMESLEIALSLGADAAEMDVRRAPDGLLYISHDKRSGSEIREKHTLEEVLHRIADTDLKFNCDIKEPFAIPGVITLAQQYGLGPDRLIFTGAVSPFLLAQEPSIAENSSVWLNVEEAMKILCMGKLLEPGKESGFSRQLNIEKSLLHKWLQQEENVVAMLALSKGLGVKGINLNHRMLSPELSQQIRGAGLCCSVWTIKEEAALCRVLDMGVDNITTTTVALVQQAMNNRK